jgi:hypothetical protein
MGPVECADRVDLTAAVGGLGRWEEGQWGS